ncbi:hypothetical protein CY0110_18982 [Crocosphaera chwakensis CCY0110]|uniref:Uncharacterized protein n=1 Tax=Crocosphaera chwakensis CCY0110 TaxID=391612 RepID=A3IJC8_9CHRO|nr:hypothetical protein CY0110_18982 [Crocosphaera chwakensis CCY0110]
MTPVIRPFFAVKKWNGNLMPHF